MRTGDRIRLARDRLRMTQKDLAGSDFHRSLISQIETGLIEPSLHTLTVLADRVGLPTSFFIESEGEKERATRAMDTAARLIADEQYDEAYQVLLDALTSVSSFPLRGALLVKSGDTLLRARRPVEALTHLNLAVRYMRLGDDIKMLVDSLAHLGRAFMQLNQLRAAIEALEEARWLLDHGTVAEAKQDRATKRRQKIDLTLSIGRAWAHLKEPEKALEWLREAAELAADAGQAFEVGLAHQAIALTHNSPEERDVAEYHNDIALSVFEEALHPVQRSISLCYSGYLAYREDDLPEAVRLFQQALNGAGDTPEYRLLPVEGLAVTYLSLHDHEQAAEWSNQALRLIAALAYTGLFACRQAEFASAIGVAARFLAQGDTPYLQDVPQTEITWYKDEGFFEVAWQALERTAIDFRCDLAPRPVAD
ncbi:MAG: helix-turn-helix transcriptional regulator [Firmicutes bacterium]|jgi:tetratricopeptide (TPR) repeat protein|nr:helix-turn-helix transcriptional regulator [Bacillota bacterium]